MSHDLVKIGNGALVDIDNIDAQFSLLKMFSLPPAALRRGQREPEGRRGRRMVNNLTF